MNVIILRHHEAEKPGQIEKYISYHQDNFQSIDLFAGQRIPEDAVYDAVVVMGGPMSVFDDDEYPWLREEKVFIAGAIDSGRKVLGVCLGAQLIAHVLGAGIRANEYKEIGWFDIEPSEDVANTVYGTVFDSPITTFHWHGDTFDLPKNSIRLCKSMACRNQAFMTGRNVLALQFHMEMTEEMINIWLERFKPDMTESPYVQSSAEIKSQKKNLVSNGLRLFRLLDVFFERTDYFAGK